MAITATLYFWKWSVTYIKGGIMGGLLAILLLVVGFIVYFAPSLVAYGREHPNQTSIFVLNLLLGWTLIGWVCALVWAFTASAPQVSSDGVKATDASTTKNCPFCAEPVRREAIKCKHCGSVLDESTVTGTAQLSEEKTSSTVTEDQAMKLYGITHQNEKYVFRGHRYDKLSDAISYAKQQKSRASAAR